MLSNRNRRGNWGQVGAASTARRSFAIPSMTHCRAQMLLAAAVALLAGVLGASPWAQTKPLGNTGNLAIGDAGGARASFNLTEAGDDEWTVSPAAFDPSLPLPPLVLRADALPDGSVVEVASRADSPFLPVVIQDGEGRIPLIVPDVAALQRMVVRDSGERAGKLSVRPGEDFALGFTEDQGALHLSATFWGKPGDLFVSVEDAWGRPLDPLSDEGRASEPSRDGWTDFGRVNPGEKTGFLVIPSPDTVGPVKARFRSGTGEIQEISVPYSGPGGGLPESTGVCGTPGKDGNAGTLTGVINTYYPVTSSVSAGALSIPVGTATGAATPIAAGDLLIVIQMQDAQINSANTSAYGDGTTKGYGYTALNTSGRYEYVVAAGAVSGGFVPVLGAGAGNGTLYAYTVAQSSSSRGRSSAQVVRVPQYMTATLSPSLTCKAWDGSTGGILAMDVSARLTLNGTTSVNGMGFRGGIQQNLTGQTTPTVNSTDYRIIGPADGSTAVGTGGMKGEGIAGTPRLMANADNGPGLDGYPNGDWYRGGPGNAGGGGNDSAPTSNQQNAGGGGGGNGGIGGGGGASWNGNQTIGGLPGGAVTASAGVAVLGGGGGAGSRNNLPVGGDGSGAAGGGIVLIRTLTVSGTGAITANGLDASVSQQDAAGGGGAGGTIIIYAKTGGLSGLSTTAQGGRGGDAWPAQTPGTWPGNHHGPGGGGGGGSILLSSAPGAASVNGGMNGTSCTDLDAYGSNPGSLGTISTTLAEGSIPGADPGYLCATPSSTITKSSSAGTGYAGPGEVLTYTINVTNTTSTSWTNVAVNDPLPAGTAFVTASTQVTKVTYPTGNYADSFAGQNYMGSTGSLTWSASTPWTEIGDGGSATGGNVQLVADPYGGAGYSLRINNTTSRGIYRALNLSGYTNAALSFRFARSAMTQNDTMNVQVSTNGGSSWTTLKTITGYYYNSGNTSITDPAFLTEYYDLTPYISANFRIRFYPGATFANTIYFDDINISVATTTVVNPIGGAPPTLVTGQTLNPGESMTITYQVTVNDPLNPSITAISNTATVTTDQGISQPASVSNPVIPAPVVFGPIYTLDTSISGTSAVIGGTLTVYRNGVSIGTTTVQSDGTWTLAGVSGLAAGNTITAKVSSNGAISAASNAVTVLATPYISKRDNAGTGYASPGQTLTYTVVVTNTTASPWSSVAVTDPLPANTTYVANSCQVTTQTTQTGAYLDQFSLTPPANPQSFQGSDGSFTWPSSTPWTEIGESDGATSGNVRVATDAGVTPSTNALRICVNGYGAYRQADLSNFTSATLTYNYRRVNNSTTWTCTTSVDYSLDGSSWTNLDTIATINGDDSAYQSSGAIPLPAAALSANFRLRFVRTGTSTSTSRFTYVDNVQISGTRSTTSTVPGGSPPNLASGYSLNPGATLTVTFQATVDPNLGNSVSSIANTATVTASGGISQQASVTNPVLPAPAVGSPIVVTAASIGGTSTAPSGYTVTVYKNGTAIGTTAAQAGGTWTLAGVSGLSAGDVITARCNYGGATSPLSNAVIVQHVPPVVTGPIAAGASAIGGTSAAPAGTTITVYKDGVSIGTTTVQAGGTWTLTGVSGLLGGEAITAKAGTGASQSAVSNTVVVTPAPPVVDGPILAGATTVSGTSTAPAGSTITVYKNGSSIGTTTVQPGGTWTLSGISPALAAGDSIKATVTAGSQTSADSNVVTVQALPTRPPIVSSPLYAGGPQTILGSSIEPAGTTITVYKNGVSIGTTTVQADGTWSLAGVTLVEGDLIKATAQIAGHSVSPDSNVVRVAAIASGLTPPPVITGTYSAGDIVVGGTFPNALAGVTVDVYADGAYLGTTTTYLDAGVARWSLSPVTPLAAGAILTATATAPCPAACTGTSALSGPVIVGSIIDLLRDDSMTTLTQSRAPIFVYPAAAPPYPSLEPLGPNHVADWGEGALQQSNGTSYDDKAYLSNVSSGQADPDPTVLTDNGRPLVFYQLLDNNAKTLKLIKSGGQIVFTITP